MLNVKAFRLSNWEGLASQIVFSASMLVVCDLNVGRTFNFVLLLTTVIG
jgi:hypothetical protein